ncbi:hypothetical protein PENANT_c123G06592 [Penicillium antarcticum]|uniref:Uncharacterized protein n=1 Tax=Penicillium antarcticum TaxID=416450 RepID=A0A1V6PIC6_9EURO|nr:hypothetical protein PENANT_c123G06592 [Penicillium antarcticum]
MTPEEAWVWRYRNDVYETSLDKAFPERWRVPPWNERNEQGRSQYWQVLLVSEPGTVLFVYNGSAANALVASLLIFQNITGLRAIHGLIWDEQGQILCAVGTDAAADGTDPVPAYGTIVRKSLVSEDRGLHAFDIGTGQLTEHYENVTNQDH